MNKLLYRARFFIALIFVLVTLPSYSQGDLIIEGKVLHSDGSPAVEVGLILLIVENAQDDFISTDENGNYSFSIDLAESSNNGCFSVLMADCDTDYIFYDDCYSEEELYFKKDFVFCENGSDDCSAFIIINPSEFFDSLNLSTVNFGVGPYSYLWEDGNQEATNSLPNLYQGTFCVTITDAEACVTTACADFWPVDPCFVYISEENGYNSLILNANGFGHSEEIDYQWSTEEQNAQINVTQSGEYCVTMTDEQGCQGYDCLYVSVDSSEWLDCYANIFELISNDGQPNYLAVEAFGTAPFSYEWILNGSIISTSDLINPTEDGYYCVTVTDSTNCSYTICDYYFLSTDCSVYICEDEENSGNLIAQGTGVFPISYFWNTGETTSSISVESIGEYCVSSIDATGCISNFCFIVDVEPPIDCSASILTENFNDSISFLSIQIPECIITDDITFLWNTGEVFPVLAVEEEGLYCITVTLENGHSFETCTYYIPGSPSINNGLAISYFNEAENQGEHAEVELYKVECGELFLYDILLPSQILNTQGFFYSDIVEDGTYVARVKPTEDDKYIPSYPTRSAFWDESDYFSVNNGGVGLRNVIKISPIPVIDIQGEGQISGTSLSDDFNENIMLFKDQEVVGQVYTDISGYFEFDMLPYGTYTVVRERPGKLRDVLTVTITAANPYIYEDFPGEITSTSENNIELGLTLLPNPTTDIINISSELFSGDTGFITLFDVNGKIVNGFDSIVYNGQMVSLDVTDLFRGVYFVRLQVGDKSRTKKVTKL